MHFYTFLFFKTFVLFFFQERASLIDKQYEADKEKLHKIRLLLVSSNLGQLMQRVM